MRRVRVGRFVTCPHCGEPQPGPDRARELEELDTDRQLRKAARRAAAERRRKLAAELEPAEPPPPPTVNGNGHRPPHPTPAPAPHAQVPPTPAPAPPRAPSRWSLGSLLSGQWEGRE